MTLDLPDLESMPPEDWLRRIDQIRDTMIGELADLLGETDDPAKLADQLDDAFSQLRRGQSSQSTDDDRTLRVQVELDGDEVVCHHEHADIARRLHHADGDWHIEFETHRQLDHDQASTDPDDDHHRRLAHHLLELLPWWSKHAFTPQSRT